MKLASVVCLGALFPAVLGYPAYWLSSKGCRAPAVGEKLMMKPIKEMSDAVGQVESSSGSDGVTIKFTSSSGPKNVFVHWEGDASTKGSADGCNAWFTSTPVAEPSMVLKLGSSEPVRVSVTVAGFDMQSYTTSFEVSGVDPLLVNAPAYAPSDAPADSMPTAEPVAETGDVFVDYIPTTSGSGASVDTTLISEFFKPQNSKRMSDDLDYNVHWTVSGDEIHLGLEAPTTGWVGFGFAEGASGSMPGADILLGWINEDGKAEIKDTHALGLLSPVVDANQDWELLGGKKINGKTYIAAKRKLSTGDLQDRNILITSEIPVVIAYGVLLNGNWIYHADKRLAAKISLTPAKANPFDAILVDPDIQFFDLLNDEMLTTSETQYIDKFAGRILKKGTRPDFIFPTECKDSTRIQRATGLTCEAVIGLAGGSCDKALQGFPTTLRQTGFCAKTCGDCDGTETISAEEKANAPQVHIVAIEPLIERANAIHVHHYVIYGRSGDDSEASLWAWGPGSAPLVAPSACGFPAGPGGFTDFRINTHYDNPEGKTGIRDRSGVRIYYTTKKRETDCGMMQTGDPQGFFFGTPLGKGLVKNVFECPSNVLAEKLGNQPRHVFGSLLHMHLLGHRMWTKLTTTGEQGEKKEIMLNRNDYYDEAFQIIVPLDITLKPGDALQTTCIHNSPDDQQKWGLGSREEMCIDFIYYYPALNAEESYCGMRSGGTRSSSEVLTADDAFSFGTNGKGRETRDQFGCYSGYQWCEAAQRCAEKAEGCSPNLPVIPPTVKVELSEETGLVGCIDDALGEVAKAGSSCAVLKGLVGCSFDLNQVNPAAPAGTLVSLVCPASCNACPKIPEPEAAAPTATGCVDDPTGDVAAAGSSCLALIAFGCDFDLNQADPATPAGTLVRLACPSSCGACPKTAEPEASAPVSSCPTAQYRVHSLQFPTTCLDGSNKNGVLKLAPCKDDSEAQKFTFQQGQLMHNEKCVSVDKNKIALGQCTDKPTVTDFNAFSKQFQFGGKCLNAKTKKALNLLKCADKPVKAGKKQGFYMSPVEL